MRTIGLTAAVHEAQAILKAQKDEEKKAGFNNYDVIRGMGGPARASLTVVLAQVDIDNRQKIKPEDVLMVQRIIQSTRDELLNAGVVAALILSIMFSLAYQEDTVMLEIRHIATLVFLSWPDH